MSNRKNTQVDYLTTGHRVGLVWAGILLDDKKLRAAYLPTNSHQVTKWVCPKHGVFIKASLVKIRTWKECPVCRSKAAGRDWGISKRRPYRGRRRVGS